MSHFNIGVLLDKNEQNIEEALDKILGPYCELTNQEKFINCHEEVKQTYNKKKHLYDNEEDFLDAYGYEKNSAGEYGYYINPNAKWDWFRIGGRWENLLITKDGKRCSYAKIKDIDWDFMENQGIKKAKEIWRNRGDNDILYLFNGISDDDTEESYIDRYSKFDLFAFVTIDGKWHSKHTMGGFCLKKPSPENDDYEDNIFNSFIKTANEDDILVIVDCHI